MVVLLRCHCGVTQSHASHPSHRCGWFVLGMEETESQWGRMQDAVDAGFPRFPLDRGQMQSPELLSPLCSCWGSPKQEIDVKMFFFPSPMSSASPSRSHSAPHSTLTFCCPNRPTPKVEHHLGAFRALQTPCILGWLTETELLLGKSSMGEKPPLLGLSSRGQAPSVTWRPHTHPHPRGAPCPQPPRSSVRTRSWAKPGVRPPSPRRAPRLPGDSRVSPRSAGSATARLAAGGQS